MSINSQLSCKTIAYRLVNPALENICMIINKLLGAVLFMAVTIAHAAAPEIAVDGNAADWQVIPTRIKSSGQSLKSFIRGEELFVLVQGNTHKHYILFVNSDGNSKTGYQVLNWSQSGADYAFANGQLYRHTGPGWAWVPEVKAITTQALKADTLEIRIHLASLGQTNSTLDYIGLGLMSADINWALTAILPQSGAMNNVFPTHQGIVIPAYLGLEDTADQPNALLNWSLLAEGANRMRTALPSKDFWVVVNGKNGLFAATEWAKAASVWDPIRANKGKIFGYVHTCTTTEIGTAAGLIHVAGPKFRSLDELKAEISAWVKGYPALDGIWLDEYNPRFELAEGNSMLTGPTYPNGKALAPLDRNFVDAQNRWNDNQVNPAGGFYDQLTRWIHETHPTLRIIGNAGGAFYSNQIYYTNLVDVVVSFEQSYSVASNLPANNWTGLTLQNPNAIGGQLALIHGNTSDLVGALNQAFAHGYSHVYTTDRALWSNNIWADIPPYLGSEIELIRQR